VCLKWFGNSPSASTALSAGADIWTSADLCAHIRHRASHLAASGVSAGQVVLAPDSPALDLLLTQHALIALGAALLPYRSGLAPAAVQQLAAQTGAEWSWSPTAAQLTATGCVSPPPQRVDQPLDALALLIATSGSTATPKVVMLTLGTLLASARAVNARLEVQPGDLWLGCLRLSHIGGISIAYRTALAGATLLLHDGFNAAAVNADLRRLPVTHISLVPPMLARLLEIDPTPPPSLRVLLVGGQALSSALAQRTLAAGWPLVRTYGMTETASQIATQIPPSPPFSKGGDEDVPFSKGGDEDVPFSKGGKTRSSVAKDAASSPPFEKGGAGGISLLPDVEIDAPHCVEQLRRLRVRGALVMAGYATPTRQLGIGLTDGWFETADLGCLATDGRLHLHGRADAVRVIGGNNVVLAHVEAVLNGAAAVTEAVIVVLEDDVWGHRLIGVYRGSATSAEVQRHCQAHLHGAELPRCYLRVRQLPLLASGKYDRQRLSASVQRLLRRSESQQ
jgi:o-succinylbenzoate---CoA ligase